MKCTEKKIENFTITETPDKVTVDYKKTSKDCFDAAITVIIGILISIATYFLLFQGIKTMSYITIAGGLIFAFQAVYQTISGISRVFQPVKNLLIIDKNTKKLISKHSLLSSKTFLLDEVETLLVIGQKEKIFTGEQLKRTYCTITLKLKNNSAEQLFIINTNRFFQISSKKTETELYTQAKRLTSELNKHLKLNYT
ncbi:hypothetical protein [Chryseobacterium indologenes]|uniref:Uncharacterized protein n=1 Tax=Chryseobacterium indologenes TaxID=253 RepID=A0A0N0ZTU6_CHRID|nr:hypothetical protein [Chryseobacterium indologenes]KPE50498.1 hypothetical protein AOB46_13990 [Chryseobacterium indologenes]